MKMYKINDNKPYFQSILRVLINILKVVDLEDQYGYRIVYKKIKVQIRKQYVVNNTKSKIHYTSYTTVRFTEPRFIMIKKQLESILSFFTLHFDGREIFIRGFRPKLEYWCTSPPTTLLENLGSPTSQCNAQCKLCYLKGVPFWEPYVLSMEEVETRLKYYSPKTKKGIFLSSHEYGEPFLNPDFLKILKLVRKKCPDEVLYPIITNGTFLSEPVVKYLAQLKPLVLDVSLNAITVDTRKKLMGGRNHEIAINSIKLLRKYGMPFRGTIIAWPELSYGELERTIRYLDEHEAQLICLYPPGYTKYHHLDYTINQINTHWINLVEFFLKMRHQISSPLLYSPNSFWNKDLRAIVDGVIKNSPAEKAGVKVGDIIYSINEHKVFSRESARNKLQNLSCEMNSNEIAIAIIRSGNIITFKISEFKDRDKDFYPYKPKGYLSDPTMPYGIILVETFKPFFIKYLREILNRYAVHRVIIFVSLLMQPQMELLLRYYKLKELLNGVKVKFVMMKNLFWGGNIMLGDLMTVDDFIYLITNSKEIKQFSPDIIILPSSFLIRWGRDYTGKYYKEIERTTSIKIVLLPCRPISL